MKVVRRHIPAVVLAVLLVGALVGPAGAAKSFGQRFDSQVKMKLSKSGTINSSDNPVHWTKLKGVPAVFADGADNGLTDINDCPVDHAIRVVHGDATVECVAVGDITGVTAGAGLTGGATSGDASVAVDYTKTQERVDGTCTAGASISEIKQDGTVTCASGGPLAAGWVQANGNKGGGTANFTSAFVTDHYEITVTGSSYSLSGFVTLVTPVACPDATFHTEATTGKVRIDFEDSQTGNSKTCNFHFAVFDI